MTKKALILAVIIIAGIVCGFFLLTSKPAGGKALINKKIALVYSWEENETHAFCTAGKETGLIQSRFITHEVISLLEKRLREEGAEVIVMSSFNQEAKQDRSIDLFLGITHTKKFVFDESGDSDVSLYFGIESNPYVDLAQAIRDNVVASAPSIDPSGMSFTLRMGSDDEGKRTEEEYRPFALTVRAYKANSSEAACDYLNRQEKIREESEAMAQGIIAYYSDQKHK